MEHALTNSKFLRQSSKLTKALKTDTSEYNYYLPSDYEKAPTCHERIIMNAAGEYYS